MRTGTFVADEEVLAVVLGDIATSLTYSCAEIKRALKSGEWGSDDVNRDFLEPDADDIVIKRKNSKKRRCCALVLSKLPNALGEELKRGEYFLVFFMCIACECMHV